MGEEKLNSLDYSHKLSTYERKLLHELCNTTTISGGYSGNTEIILLVRA